MLLILAICNHLAVVRSSMEKVNKTLHLNLHLQSHLRIPAEEKHPQTKGQPQQKFVYGYLGGWYIKSALNKRFLN